MNLTSRLADGAKLYTLNVGQEEIGYVAIDSTIDGRSCGGLRLLPDIDADEILGLSRAMTLKYGFLGLPQGGAKAGVRGDPEASIEKRHAALISFGTGIESLLREGIYAPYPDMGTSAADIRAMLAACKVHIPTRAVRDHDSGYYTAVSVAASAEAAIARIGMEATQCTVAIEGFGKVGKALAKILCDAGYTVVAVSTRHGAIYDPRGLDIPRLMGLSRSTGSQCVSVYTGAQQIPVGKLLELPVSLLCPCARHNTLRSDNAPKVQCRVVAPGANIAVTWEAEKLLIRRGIICLPDFVANSGGVLGGTMQFAGISHRRIVATIRFGMLAAAGELLEKSAKTGLALRTVAEQASRERFKAIKRRAENPTPAGRLLYAGLKLYRLGLIPSALVGILGIYYFKRLPLFSKLPTGSTG